MKNKSLILAIALALLVVIPLGVWFASQSTASADGQFSHTSSTPEIWGEMDWQSFCQSTSDFSGKTVKLMTSLELIGSVYFREASFAGTFEGNGHTITLSGNSEGWLAFQTVGGGLSNALFYDLNGGTIRNLVVVLNANKVFASNAYGMAETMPNDGSVPKSFGILAGTASNYSRITNCAVIGTDEGTTIDYRATVGDSTAVHNVGAIVGQLTDGSQIEYCFSDVAVDAYLKTENRFSSIYAGGLVGRLSSPSNSGAGITGSIYVGDYVKAYNTTSNFYLDNSFFITQAVLLKCSVAGGMVGLIDSSGTNVSVKDSLVRTTAGVYTFKEQSGTIISSSDFGNSGLLFGFNYASYSSNFANNYANADYASSSGGYQTLSALDQNLTGMDHLAWPASYDDDSSSYVGLPNLKWLLQSDTLASDDIDIDYENSTVTIGEPEDRVLWNYALEVPVMGKHATPAAKIESETGDPVVTGVDIVVTDAAEKPQEAGGKLSLDSTYYVNLDIKGTNLGTDDVPRIDVSYQYVFSLSGTSNTKSGSGVANLSTADATRGETISLIFTVKDLAGKVLWSNATSARTYTIEKDDSVNATIGITGADTGNSSVTIGKSYNLNLSATLTGNPGNIKITKWSYTDGDKFTANGTSNPLTLDLSGETVPTGDTITFTVEGTYGNKGGTFSGTATLTVKPKPVGIKESDIVIAAGKTTIEVDEATNVSASVPTPSGNKAVKSIVITGITGVGTNITAAGSANSWTLTGAAAGTGIKLAVGVTVTYTDTTTDIFTISDALTITVVPKPTPSNVTSAVLSIDTPESDGTVLPDETYNATLTIGGTNLISGNTLTPTVSAGVGCTVSGFATKEDGGTETSATYKGSITITGADGATATASVKVAHDGTGSPYTGTGISVTIKAPEPEPEVTGVSVSAKATAVPEEVVDVTLAATGNDLDGMETITSWSATSSPAGISGSGTGGSGTITVEANATEGSYEVTFTASGNVTGGTFSDVKGTLTITVEPAESGDEGKTEGFSLGLAPITVSTQSLGLVPLTDDGQDSTVSAPVSYKVKLLALSSGFTINGGEDTGNDVTKKLLVIEADGNKKFEYSVNAGVKYDDYPEGGIDLEVHTGKIQLRTAEDDRFSFSDVVVYDPEAEAGKEFSEGNDGTELSYVTLTGQANSGDLIQVKDKLQKFNDENDPKTNYKLAEGATINVSCTSSNAIYGKSWAENANYYRLKYDFSGEGADKTPTPTISPSAGVLIGNDARITFECTDPEATIYYTLDGSNPRTSGTKVEYTGQQIPFPDMADVTEFTVRAYAVSKGNLPSDVAFTKYQKTVIYGVPSIPELLVNGIPYDAGSYYNSGDVITLRSPKPEYPVYYTLNETNPTTSSNKVTNDTQFTLTISDIEVRAIAHNEKNNIFSETAVWNIRLRGSLNAPEIIGLRDGDAAQGDEYYFSLSSSLLQQLSSDRGFEQVVYSAETTDANIAGSTNVTVRGNPKEGITYITEMLPTGGTSTLPSIRYTLDGSDPTGGNGINYVYGRRTVTQTVANAYTVTYTNPEPLVITGSPGDVITIKAAAIGDAKNFSGSETITRKVTIREKLAPPTTIPAEAKVVEGGNIIFNVKPETIIFYTLNGKGGYPQATYDGEKWVTNETTLRYEDGDEIPVPVGSTAFSVYAFAVHETDALEPSEVAEITFEVSNLDRAAKPVATAESVLADGTLKNGDMIRLTTETPNTDIYYSTDGVTVPSEDSLTADIASGKVKKFSGSVPMAASREQPYFTIIAVAMSNTSPVQHTASVPAYITYRLSRADTPVANPAPAEGSVVTLAPGEVIKLYCSTPGATIYYTTDDSSPSPGSGTTKLYNATEGIVMEETSTFFTVRAVAQMDTLYDDSLPAVFQYQVPAPVQAVFATPIGGEVLTGTQVTLSCTTADAKIFFTVDGSEPKANESQAYASPITISSDITIKAIAEKDGVTSAVTTNEYTLAKQLAAPTISLASGSMVNKGTIVKLSAEGNIAYTTDGSDPKKPDAEKNTVQYGESVVLDADYGSAITIRAYAYKDGFQSSETASFTYTVSERDDYLTATPASGSTVAPGTTVILSTTLTGGKIFYTVGDAVPTAVNNAPEGSFSWSPGAGSTQGNSVIVSGAPGSTFTIRAITAADGAEGGVVRTFNYQINDRAAAPYASIPDGAITLNGAEVTLEAEDNARIYYTTDGSMPTTASVIYSAPIKLTRSTVLRAFAAIEGLENSEVVTYNYTHAGYAATPIASIANGAIEQGTQITLSCSTEGATIYYTTDGSTPTKSSQAYSSPIPVMRPITLKAIAIKSGLHNSEALSASYTVIKPVEPVPDEKTDESMSYTQTDRLESRRTYGSANKGPSFTDIIINNSEHGMLVAAMEGVLSKDVALRVTQQSISDADERAVKNNTGFTIVSMYDITLVDGSETIQPNGEVEVGIKIPDKYLNAVIVVLRINDDGSVEAFTTRREGNMAYFMTNHFSKYAITVTDASMIEGDGISPWLIGIIAGAAVAVAVIAIFVRSRNKKAGKTKA